MANEHAIATVGIPPLPRWLPAPPPLAGTGPGVSPVKFPPCKVTPVRLSELFLRVMIDCLTSLPSPHGLCIQML